MGTTWTAGGGSCTRGPTIPVTPPVTPTEQCPAANEAFSWGSGCTGQINVAATNSGGTYSLSNTTAGYTGTASWSCNRTTWTSTAITCVPDAAPVANECPAINSFYSWGPSGACSGQINVGSTASGSSYSLANEAPGHTGAASWSCVGTTWTPGVSSCVPDAVVPVGTWAAVVVEIPAVTCTVRNRDYLDWGKYAVILIWDCRLHYQLERV